VHSINKKNCLDKSSYLPNELIKMLTPGQVEKTFGISKETLTYWREETKDTGVLRGPAFFNDGNTNLYQVNALIDYITNHYHSGGETKETQETKKTEKTLKAVKS
jgi:hypothetical protein